MKTATLTVKPQAYSQRLAELIAHRVGRLNRVLRDQDSDRLISHNGNWAPPPTGLDLYEAGVPGSKPDFFNGDHHGKESPYGDWLDEYNTARQVEKLRGLDPDLPALMVTQMRLEGRVWSLEDWGNETADWDRTASWQAMGERNEKPLPDPELGRIRRRLGWKYDLIKAYQTARTLKDKPRQRFVNDPAAQAAERKLLEDDGAGGGDG